jgi:hypothetical protein
MRTRILSAVVGVTLALAVAAPASARIVQLEDGYYLPDGRNLTVGSLQRSPTDMRVPAAFVQSPTGALERTIEFPNAGAGILLDGSVVNGTAYALHDVYNGFRVIAFNPLSGEVICQGPVIDGDGRAIAVVGVHVYVVGADEVDEEKAIYQLATDDCELDPDPDTGDPFAGDAQVTQDPSTGSDVFTDVETDGDELFLVGEENAKDVLEFDIYDLEGNLIDGFALDPGDPDAINAFDLELDLGADGDMDADDVMYVFGGFGFQGFVAGRERDGGIPGICPSPTPDADGFVPWEIVPGTNNIDLVTGAMRYPGMGWAVSGNSLSFGGDFTSFINFYDPSFCDPAAGWVALFPGFRTSFVSGLERPNDSTVFAFGDLSQDPNVETLGFKTQRMIPSLGMGSYGSVFINPFGTPGGPGPGPDGDGGPGPGPGGGGDQVDIFDYNGDGKVDYLDFLLRRNRSVVDAKAFTIYTPTDPITPEQMQVLIDAAVRGSGSSAAAKRIRLARRTATLQGGGTKRVRVPLTRAGKRFVRKYRRKRLRVRITFRARSIPATGTPQTANVSGPVTFRVKRKWR